MTVLCAYVTDGYEWSYEATTKVMHPGVQYIVFPDTSQVLLEFCQQGNFATTGWHFSIFTDFVLYTN